MIKLEIDNLSSLIKNHLNVFYPMVKGSAQLYIDLLNAEVNGKFIPTKPKVVSSRYNLNGHYINSSVLVISDLTSIDNERVFSFLTTGTTINIKPFYRDNAADLIDFLEDIIDDAEIILTGEPFEIEACMSLFINNYPTLVSDNKFVKEVVSIINRIFDYDYFSDRPVDTWGAHELTRKLNINVCPYCNRNYTTTVIRDELDGTVKAVRPHLDHFFSQADNPLLVISFYNLIPCCSVCNSSLKGKTVFKLSSHLHPYLYGFGSNSMFTFEFAPKINISNGQLIKIKLDVNDGCDIKNQIEGSKSCFLLEDIYQSHTDLVQEMIYKEKAYSANYLSILSNQYKGLDLKEDELYRQAFGAYLYEKDFVKRPLSKLIRDIAKDLEMI